MRQTEFLADATQKPLLQREENAAGDAERGTVPDDQPICVTCQTSSSSEEDQLLLIGQLNTMISLDAGANVMVSAYLFFV